MTQGCCGTIAVLAPAKVNLYLHVLGRRPDGYHLLDSLVVFVDIGDLVEVAEADRLGLSIDGPFANDVPRDGDNLVLCAARALANAVGRPAAASIRLTKRLPVAAGLGGGSADAAAVLRALLRLWGIELDDQRLQALALSLGADVPMCLGARLAFAGGIGERIEPAFALPPCALVLVNPRLPLPTARVFARRDGAFSPPARSTAPAPNACALAQMLAERRNDLTAAAVALVPEVAAVLAALEMTPGVLLSRMSGSGATCFGLCADAPAARSAAAALAARHPHWWIEVASVAGSGFSG